MKQVKTARGRVIDMGALAKANEKERAVSPGNVNMNARGDIIDRSGNVVETVQAKSRKVHNTSSAPERRKMSDTPNVTKTKKAAAPAPDPIGPEVVRREERERDDGTRYIEIEYSDGSMDVEEIE